MNAAALGARVRFLSAAGTDAYGAALCGALDQASVDICHLVRTADRPTPAKSRVIADSQIVVRFDESSGRHALPAEAEERICAALEAYYPESDVVIVSDYDCGVISPAVIARLKALQSRHAAVLAVDSKRRLAAFREAETTLVKPNYSEALLLLGITDPPSETGRRDFLLEQGHRILSACHSRIAAITLDRAGSLIFERDKPVYRTYSRPVTNSSAVGAGDTYIAAFALALGAGASTPAAAEIASAAAAVVLSKTGTAVCRGAELDAGLRAVAKMVPDAERLAAELETRRREGKRIVFTNGCFDLLHSGHISCLSRARELGDILVVAVNSDESIARIKGAGRPINKLEERLQVLNALSCVDYLVSFGEDTACSLVRRIKPDIFVKSADSRKEAVPELAIVAEYGGKAEFVPPVLFASTSTIIERIRGVPAVVEIGAGKAKPAATWQEARQILCMRLDTIGDVLMCEPAIRALKETFGARLALLTSARGGAVAPLIPEIDEVIAYDAPWMKATSAPLDGGAHRQLLRALRQRGFDAAVIFTSYTQSALPAALLCCLADIPHRLAHCRENPYHLLTVWQEETEPVTQLRHEVRRQLDLAAAVGARTADERIRIAVPPAASLRVRKVLARLGVSDSGPWILLHPGASAPSRRYPAEYFAEAARVLTVQHGVTIILTGSTEERPLIEEIQARAGAPLHSLAGELSLIDLAALIQSARLLLTNNTGPAHLAAAAGTPVVDLYALTNPQHTPWLVPQRVLFSDVPCRYCYKSICPQGHHDCLRRVSPAQVVDAALALLAETMQPQTGLEKKYASQH